MNGTELPSQIIKVLSESHFAYFCTTDQNNQAHITPMFFLFDKETNDIFVFSYVGSKKMKNIKVNPKVCLTVDIRDSENPFENQGVMAQGKAMIEPIDLFSVEKTKKREKIFDDFKKKYPMIDEEQIPTRVMYQEYAEALLKVRSKKMVYWKGPHFLTVNFDPESGTLKNVTVV